MGKSRLEAFSDGVLAIVITIMVLELKVPHDASWQSLTGLIPVFLGYVLSFIYGCILLAAALAYWILQQTIIISEGAGSLLRQAIGADWKGKTSLALYAVAIGLTVVSLPAAQFIDVAVASFWLVPDRRIEQHLRGDG
jgi:uncharacterized membrane protein